jgi:hypothetical protein
MWVVGVAIDEDVSGGGGGGDEKMTCHLGNCLVLLITFYSKQ